MGFFSKIFASTNATGHTAVDDAEAARQAQIKKIEALLDSVNSASQHVRNYYITFLLACFYIAMIVWSTTDLMLLKDTPVTMPLLNVNLPITGFYTFAPYFFLLLHFNLLLQFSLLADKTHHFDQAVAVLDDGDSRRHYYTRLFAFAFTQILSARHHSRLLRFLLTLMVWITTIWLPLGILIGLQVGFLPYHDEDILSWQRIAAMLDLLVLLIFWPVIRAPDSRWRSWVKQTIDFRLLLQTIQVVASWLARHANIQHSLLLQPENSANHTNGQPLLEGSIGILTSFSVIVFVWAIAVLPDSSQEQNVRDWLQTHSASDWWQSFCKSEGTGRYYFIATEWLFDGRYEFTQERTREKQCNYKPKASMLHRNLILREQLLIANELKAEDEADLKSSDETIRGIALKKVTGLVLSDRNLRYADFSEARLPKVDFVGANDKPSDLRYANFSNAMLVNAEMGETTLRGANFSFAQLQGAWLWNAELQKAWLWNAELQGANLRGAKLQGADLEEAQLQGVDLKEAELRGANLLGAQLQGANLVRAQLQGAYLKSAQLQGVNLLGAIFSYADITAAQFGWLTQSSLENLQETLIETIRDEKLRKNINDDLTERTKEQIGIFSLQGEIVWDGSFRNRFYSALNELEFNGSESDYQNKLASYLINLACQDRWTVAGIVRNRINLIKQNSFLIDLNIVIDLDNRIALASSAAQCLLSLKDLNNEAEQPTCPAMSGIDQETLQILQETAAKKNPDTSIVPTFSCRTERSDPVLSTE